MTKEQLIDDLYSELIDEKVRASMVTIRGISCRVILKRSFRKLIWFIYFIRVPRTYKTQKTLEFS